MIEPVVAQYGPCFPVAGETVTVLQTPREFYDRLRTNIRASKKRVVLASLYLGNTDYEATLVDDIAFAINSNSSLKSAGSEQFRVRVLIDETRGSRGMTSSVSLLQPLLHIIKANVDIRINLYLTPRLNGLLKHLLKPPLNETISLTHIKAYVCDNKLIISGANLSEHYFSHRQDRYIEIENEGICNFMEDLVDTVGGASSTLTATGISRNPLLHARDFGLTAGASIQRLIEKYQRQRQPTIRCEVNGKDHVSKIDTRVYPLLQMGPWGIKNDEICSVKVFESLPTSSNLYLATGYFNLTSRYADAILKSKASFNVLTASPNANGFLGARGIMGHIPTVYTFFLREFWNRRQHSGRNIVLREWQNNDMTFHAKGLWGEERNENTSFTFIGSPNFGHRSTTRDLECQLAIFSANGELRNSLENERMRLFANGTEVDNDTFRDPQRKVQLWEKIAAKLIRSFF